MFGLLYITALPNVQQLTQLQKLTLNCCLRGISLCCSLLTHFSQKPQHNDENQQVAPELLLIFLLRKFMAEGLRKECGEQTESGNLGSSRKRCRIAPELRELPN